MLLICSSSIEKSKYGVSRNNVKKVLKKLTIKLLAPDFQLPVCNRNFHYLINEFVKNPIYCIDFGFLNVQSINPTR